MSAARTTGSPPTSTQPSNGRAVLAIVLVSYFMVVLDNSIIFTGVPQIAAALDLTPAGLSWVQNAYTLVFGGLLLLGARAGDLLGRRRVFTVGLVVFGVASLLVGLAQNGAWIIAARALQGVGAAVVAPTSLALVTSSFPAGPQRARAVAAYGTTAGVGASLGLVVGGALADWVSWRAGFFINVPIAAAVLIASARHLPALPRTRGTFDVTGALTSTVGMGSLVLGIVSIETEGFASPRVLTLLGVAVVVLGVFVLDQWRARQPIMPLRLFASRQRSGAAVSRLLFAGSMISFFFFTSQFLQGVYGWTPLQAGLAFLPMTVVQFVVALRVGRLVRRWGGAPVVVLGLAMVTLGMLWLTRIDAGTSYLLGFAGPLLLLGVGQGLTFAPLTAAGIAGVQPADAGAASGLVNTAHQLGSTVGIAVLTAVGAGVTGLADRVAAAYAGATVMLVVALVAAVVLVLPGERSRSRSAQVTGP